MHVSDTSKLDYLVAENIFQSSCLPWMKPWFYMSTSKLNKKNEMKIRDKYDYSNKSTENFCCCNEKTV